MSRQRTFSILVIVSLLSILVAGGVSLYIRNRRNRLIDMEERLEALRQLLNESKQSVAEEEKPDSAFFRKVLLQQLGVIRLMATTPTQQNKELLQQMTRITNEDVPRSMIISIRIWSDCLMGVCWKKRSSFVACYAPASLPRKSVWLPSKASVRSISARRTSAISWIWMRKRISSAI